MPHDDFHRLILEAMDLPDGRLKVELLCRAAEVADIHHELIDGVRARKLILSTSLAAGLPEEMLVAFSWCVAMSDRHPELIPAETILWEYRWVISEIPHFPEVSRQQIEETIGEMTRRYLAAGSTLQAVHLLRMHTAVKMGDVATATAAYDAWAAAKRDWLSDSKRQEQNLTVNYFCFAGRNAEAIAKSKSVLAGRVDEPEFFGQDAAELLMPLLAVGRLAEAAALQTASYRYLRGKMRYLHHLGFHVEFAARTDDWARATKFIDLHLPLALETKQLYDRFQFLRACLVFAERVARVEKPVKLRLPADIPANPIGFAGWLRPQLIDLATRFDARNGNSYFHDRLTAVDALLGDCP